MVLPFVGAICKSGVRRLFIDEITFSKPLKAESTTMSANEPTLIPKMEIQVMILMRLWLFLASR